MASFGIGVGQAGQRRRISRMQMHHRARGRALVVEAEMQRQFLGRRVAGDMLAGEVELRQPVGLEEAEAGIGRREQKAVVEPDRHVAGRAGGQAALEQRLAPFDEVVADRLFAHAVPIRSTRLFEEVVGAEIAALQRQAERAVALGDQRRHAGIDLLADAAGCVTPSASTTAPEVSPPPTTMRRTPLSTSRARGRRRSARPWRRFRSRPKLCCAPATAVGIGRRIDDRRLRRSASATQAAALSTVIEPSISSAGSIASPDALSRYAATCRCEAVEQEPQSTTAGPFASGRRLGLPASCPARAKVFAAGRARCRSRR